MAKGSGGGGRGGRGSGTRSSYRGQTAAQLTDAATGFINRGESVPRGLRVARQNAFARESAAREAQFRASGERTGGAVFGKPRRRGNIFA